MTPPPKEGDYVSLWVMGRKVRGRVYHYVRPERYWVEVTLRLQSTVTGRVYERRMIIWYEWNNGVLKQVKEN